MKKRFSYIIVFLAFSSAIFAQVQTVKQLENERKETLKKMETTNNLLNQTKKSQQSSLNKLSLLKTNINERKSLINTINKEVNQLDNEISQLNLQQKELERKLDVLKADYARFVQESYINRSFYNKITFVFSAESFDQSFRRLRYLQEYTDYRKEQVKEIEKICVEIEEKNRATEKYRLTKLSVLQQKESEAKKLTKDQQSEQKMLTDLKKKEGTLKSQLKEQEKKAAQLNKKIEQMIADQIKQDETKKKKSLPKDKQDQDVTGVNALTKEEKLINGNFEANKGLLPWPVERGAITGNFGVQPHPILKNVTTDNKGIYIQTPQGADARAVFEGEVTQRFAIPGNNNAVIVKHGIYRTVYANLTEIYVKEGDKIKPKQRIGKIYTDDEHDNKTELYFQLWKEKTILNPEPWVAK